MFKSKKQILRLSLLSVFSIIFTFTYINHRKKTHNEIIILLDWLPNTNHIPLFVAKELKLFEKYGIHENIIINSMRDDSSGFSYLTNNQVDLLVSHLPRTLKAMSQGIELKLAGVLIDSPLRCLLFRDDPSIQKPQDLNNKRFGFSLGCSDQKFISYILTSLSITPSNYKNVNIDFCSAMSNNAVDFIYGTYFNSAPFQLDSIGIKTRFFKIQDLNIPTYPELIIVCKKKSQKISNTHLFAFKKALHNSMMFCIENPISAFEIYLKYNPNKSTKTITWEKNSWISTIPLLSSSQKLNKKNVQIFADFLKQINFLEKNCIDSLS